jgi:hypothetical protein
MPITDKKIKQPLSRHSGAVFYSGRIANAQVEEHPPMHPQFQ